MRRYAYVGPAGTLARARGRPPGAPVRSAADLLRWVEEAVEPQEPDGSHVATFVVCTDGVLRLAPRHSEHVACAGGGDVLSAGELRVCVERGVPVITGASNQSTGFCPEADSWPAVASALEAAGVRHPGGFTRRCVFRRCPACGQRNLVKNGVFECGVCGAGLPREWNFGRPGAEGARDPGATTS